MLKRIFKGEEKAKIEALVNMGFDASRAKNALDASDGDLERATNFLLSDNVTYNNRPNHAGTSSSLPTMETEEEQLQRVMAESFQLEEERKKKGTASSATVAKNIPSAASIRAGQAAAARAENANRRFGSNNNILKKKEKNDMRKKSAQVEKASPLKQYPSSTTEIGLKSKTVLKSHPNVKMPTQMKDKSKEEQILRCTKRLAPYPLAVDTLLRAFIFIRDQPENDRYRKIDRSSAGYQTVLEGKPGVMDLIQAMNFVPRPNSMDLVLERSRIDMALLYLGISGLEQVKKTDEYISSKLAITFEKELKRIRSGGSNSEDEEVLRRAEFISKLPSEPESGAGALMQVSLGETKIMRKFDGDDILRDVINWVGCHGSKIPEKILSRDWCLVDLNQYPLVPIDTENCLNKTLQFIGCWPSGKLALQPSSVEWKENKEIVEQVGSSRGLGAASSGLN